MQTNLIGKKCEVDVTTNNSTSGSSNPRGIINDGEIVALCFGNNNYQFLILFETGRLETYYENRVRIHPDSEQE